MLERTTRIVVRQVREGTAQAGHRTSWRRTRGLAPATLHGQLQCVKASFPGEGRQAPTHLVHRPSLCRPTLYRTNVYTEPGLSALKTKTGVRIPRKPPSLCFFGGQPKTGQLLTGQDRPVRACTQASALLLGHDGGSDHRNSACARIEAIPIRPTVRGPESSPKLDRSSEFGEDGSSPRL